MKNFLLAISIVLFTAVTAPAQRKAPDENLLVKIQTESDPINAKFEQSRLQASIWVLSKKLPEDAVQRWGHAMNIAMDSYHADKKQILVAVAIYWQEHEQARNPTATFQLETRKGQKLDEIPLWKLTKLYDQVLYELGLADKGSDEPGALYAIRQETHATK